MTIFVEENWRLNEKIVSLADKNKTQVDVEMLVDIHTHSVFDEANCVSVQNVMWHEAENFAILTKAQSLFSIGIHPCFLDAVSNSSLEILFETAQFSNVVFIGECGLDKNSTANFAVQLYFFQKQIEISEKLQKPLIIHCVGYFNELILLKKQLKPKQKWIVHGFRGKEQLALELLKFGFDLSFGKHFNEKSVLAAPLNRLFVETDESDLSISHIYQSIANVKQCSIDDLSAGKKLLKC